ncbi:MAG: trypsin-like peptidase domain-containing protein [Bryobacteraceae bacterium]|nr:trypsin-like peptidase domain-containing protein [Bryobacteraceae bacterium]
MSLRGLLARTVSIAALAAGMLLGQGKAPTGPRAERAQLAEVSSLFQDLARRVSPSVVKVLAIGYKPVDEEDESSVTTRQQSSGSGTIVDASGYVVTNAHVVLGAERLRVLLSSQLNEDEHPSRRRSVLRPRGRAVYAELVGIDVETDLAVLKIPVQNLPALAFADSEAVEQGQLVLALGSPLGLENSLSMGVVSSKARQLRSDDPMIYIQTDAPINPGNSGGPLVDTEGRIVGINTLLYTQSGGNEGIGFAAPANIVRTVYEQIRQHGRVRRGEIGVEVQTITPTLAAGWKLTRNWGVVVADVEEDGPADQAGLQVGDVVETLNGKSMENARQFVVNLYRPKSGETVSLELLRGQQRLKAQVKVTEKQVDAERFASLLTRGENLIPQLGVLVVELTPRVLEMLTPLRKEIGVLVAARAADAPFMEGGFRAGDVIYAINREAVSAISDIRSVLNRFKPGDAIAVQIERNGKLMFLSFELP